MGWESNNIFQILIVTGPSSGVFTYDASGNLRSANVGQTTTDPVQHITTYAGFSTYNGHGAVISLFSSTLDAQLWYADTGSGVQGQLVESIAPNSGTDPFGNAFLNGLTVYANDGTHFVATQIQTGLPSSVSGGVQVFSAASAAGPYTLVGGGLTVSAAGISFGQTPLLLASATTDAAGYPTFTDLTALTLNFSGCQPASGNKNTVTGTTFANLAFGTIPANDPEANAVYEVECGGYGTQAGGAAVGLTLQARFGASPGAATDVVGVAYSNSFPTIAGDSFQWSAKVRAECLTSGGAATWRIYLTGTITDTTAGGVPGVSFAVGTGPTDITQSSTAAINMGLSAEWASAVGAPTITKSGSQFGRRG